VEALAGKKEGCDDEYEFVHVQRPATPPKVCARTAPSLPPKGGPSALALVVLVQQRGRPLAGPLACLVALPLPAPCAACLLPSSRSESKRLDAAHLSQHRVPHTSPCARHACPVYPPPRRSARTSTWISWQRRPCSWGTRLRLRSSE